MLSEETRRELEALRRKKLRAMAVRVAQILTAVLCVYLVFLIYGVLNTEYTYDERGDIVPVILTVEGIRETEEEIGIPRGNIEVISQGDTMYGAAGFSLYSFIGILQYEDLDLIRFQEDEVEEVFYVPVKKLLEVRPQIYLQRMKPLIPEDFPYDRIGITENYPWRVGTYEIPVYEIEGRVIWGMTAKITEGIIERIRNYENE